MQSPKNSTKAHLESATHTHTIQSDTNIHRHIYTQLHPHTETLAHVDAHTPLARTLFTLPSGQTRQSGRGEAGINDTMISRPDLSVELRGRMRRRRMKKGEGRAVAALNTGIILHRLTLSLHITLKVSPGNVEREGGGERGGSEESWGELKGRYNDHTLLSHSPSPLSQHHTLRPQPASHSPFSALSLGP